MPLDESGPEKALIKLTASAASKITRNYDSLIKSAAGAFFPKTQSRRAPLRRLLGQALVINSVAKLHKGVRHITGWAPQSKQYTDLSIDNNTECSSRLLVQPTWKYKLEGVNCSM